MGTSAKALRRNRAALVKEFDAAIANALAHVGDKVEFDLFRAQAKNTLRKIKRIDEWIEMAIVAELEGETK